MAFLCRNAQLLVKSVAVKVKKRDTLALPLLLLSRSTQM